MAELWHLVPFTVFRIQLETERIRSENTLSLQGRAKLRSCSQLFSLNPPSSIPLPTSWVPGCWSSPCPPSGPPAGSGGPGPAEPSGCGSSCAQPRPLRWPGSMRHLGNPQEHNTGDHQVKSHDFSSILVVRWEKNHLRPFLGKSVLLKTPNRFAWQPLSWRSEDKN